jgi:hypothetical protein
MEIMAFIFVFGTDFWEQNLMTTKRHLTKYKTERRAADNTGLAKVAVQCSADTFVVNQSLVLRINICGENRHLRQARKRYGKGYSIFIR